MRQPDQLLAQLPEIAERTKAQMEEFHREPSGARAELLLAQIVGVAHHIRQISDELRRAHHGR